MLGGGEVGDEEVAGPIFRTGVEIEREREGRGGADKDKGGDTEIEDEGFFSHGDTGSGLEDDGSSCRKSKEGADTEGSFLESPGGIGKGREDDKLPLPRGERGGKIGLGNKGADAEGSFLENPGGIGGAEDGKLLLPRGERGGERGGEDNGEEGGEEDKEGPLDNVNPSVPSAPELASPTT